MLLYHCLNIRAWTSVSLNSWNAQQQGGLSSDFNNCQPSWLHLSNPDTWSPSLLGSDGISSPARHTLNPSSQETSSYVKIDCASWRSCCSSGFWKQSSCCWRILHSFWPYCCQQSPSLPKQMPSMLPVSLRSLGFSNSGSLMSCQIWGQYIWTKKACKKWHVAIAQILDLVEQNKFDFWIQHIRFALNHLKKTQTTNYYCYI